MENSRRTALKAAGGVAMLGALGAGGWLALRSGARDKERGPGRMIDMHIHVVPPRLPGLKPMPEDVDRLYAGPPEAMARRLREEMERAGVAIAFGMGCLDGPPDDPLGIASTLRLAALVPGLKAIGAIDPRRNSPDHLRAVERQIDRERSKLVALKAYLGYLHFGPEDPAYAPYYRLAASHKLPVILHTGDNWSTTAKVKYAHPLRVDEVAVDHPDVRFVLAHLGNPWLIDAAEVVYKNDNVWADLSGLFVGDEAAIAEVLDATGKPESATGRIVVEMKRAIAYASRPDRLLYGSDWPLAPMASYRRLIGAIVPEADHEAVFRTNAERLFGVVTQDG
jgi:predicted TIM-barrel fold metal-dependent hydrolase